MNENEIFEWDSIVNDPKRQKEADQRVAEENRRRAEREERLCRFHQANADRKRSRMEVEACRYGTGALVAGVAAYLAGDGGVSWLVWICGLAAAILALVACFGFGRIHEMDRAKRRAASRSSSPESGTQNKIHTDNVADLEDEVNAEYENVY